MSDVLTTKKPLVTVLVLCYQNFDMLFDTLQSILIQDCPLVQLIVSDDASKDFDADAVRRYINDNKLDNLISSKVCINRENCGTVAHLNACMFSVHGKFLKLLSPGDFFLQGDALRKMAVALAREDGDAFLSPVLACGGWVKYLTPTPKRQRQLEKLSNEDLYGCLLASNEINIIGSLLRTEAVRSAGGFDKRFLLLEDWPLWLRMVSRGYRFVYGGKPLLQYRLGGNSTNGGKSTASVLLRKDIVLFFTQDILPQVETRYPGKARLAKFEYEKHMLHLRGSAHRWLSFCARYLDIVISRKFQYYKSRVAYFLRGA